MGWLGGAVQNGTPPIQRGGWLDALRFIVAAMMILHHFELAAPVPLAHFHPVFERGYLLTNFFLMDSGYVLARVYGDRVLTGGMSPGDFFRKRALRVVPAHVIMCLGLVALVVAGGLVGVAPRHPEWFDWSQLPAQLFLVQAFGVPGGLGWNAPSWSLSALLGCYLLFPLLIRWTTAMSPWRALALGVVVYGLAHALTLSLLGHPVYQMPLKYGFLRALPLFLLGVCLAVFASKVVIAPRLAGWMFVAAALALAGFQAFGRFSLVSLALIAVIVVAAGAIPVRRRSALVERAALVSFSIFITNEVVRIAWFGVVNVLEARFGWPEPVQWALWVAGVLAAFVFAIAFHYAIDMPIQRRINGPGRSRRAEPSPAAVPAL